VFDEHTLKLQLAVPKIFNPRHQMNPLKVFASRRFENTATDTASGVASAPRYENVPEPAIHPTNAARLFEPFFDSIDGTMCGPATMTAADLEALRTSHGFRFPLILDQQMPLCEQIAASGFASASSRFGPYCDNIMGMNWKLPSGRIVRIGERVVKSTTGYDLLRFLLHSSGQFGEPVDFVLRLRPDCGTSGVFSLNGSFDAVSKAAAALLATCWIHWFDAVDVVFASAAEPCQLRIALNCPADEWAVYHEFLSSFAKTHDLSLASDSTASLSPDGCPDFMLKTTPDQVVGLAREISRHNAIRCVALCYNGVVHGYLSSGTRESCDRTLTNPPTRIVTSIIERYSKTLHEIGGDWQSRHVPRHAPIGMEAEWLKLLEQEFASV